jgi:hypothetical protein
MVGYLTNIYCPMVGHLIENFLKKSNAPPMPDPQAFSQKGVQASWDAPRTKNGRLWTPKFWGKREIIFIYFL